MSIPLIDRDGKTIGHLPNSKLANVGIVVVEDVQLSGAEDGHEVPLYRYFRYNGAVQPRDVQFVESNAIKVAKDELFDTTQETVVRCEPRRTRDVEAYVRRVMWLSDVANRDWNDTQLAGEQARDAAMEGSADFINWLESIKPEPGRYYVDERTGSRLYLVAVQDHNGGWLTAFSRGPGKAITERPDAMSYTTYFHLDSQ